MKVIEILVEKIDELTEEITIKDGLEVLDIEMVENINFF